MKKLLAVIFLLTFALTFFSSCSESNIIEPTNDQSEIVLKQKVGTIGDNLIINSNMEDGQNSFWAGGNANPNFSFSHTDKESKSSAHSLMIKANGSEKNQFAYWAQTIKTSDLVGKKLTASVSIKYNDVTESGVALVIRGDNTETPQGSAEVFGTTQHKIIKTGSGDWQTLEISINNVPENIESITVYMLLAAQNGSVYFDDLSLVSDIGQGPTYALQNTNFEIGNSYPEFWWKGATNHNQFNIELVNDIFYSSSQSVKISTNNSANEFSFWAQTIRADELNGKSINVDIKIKSENISGEGIAIAIRGDDTITPRNAAELFSTTQNNVKIEGTFDWTTYSVSMDTIPEDIKSITIYLIYLRNTSGTVYFDDINLN